MIEDKLTILIKRVLKIFEIEISHITLEHPAELSHGDYSTNVALAYAKTMGMKPRDLAEKIVAEIEKNLPKEVEKVEVAGAGFINFRLSIDFFTKSVERVVSSKENFGGSLLGAGKKVIVEYSSPNIAKPFTVGHLRSTIIGDAIANILGAQGYEVIRDNHLGDWGTQFGKQIVALKSYAQGFGNDLCSFLGP